MSFKRWTVRVTLFLGVAGWEPATAQTPATVAVRVFLQEDGQVPADVLDQAKHAASRVFALSQIDLQWIGHGPYRPCSLTVRVVAQSPGAKSRSRFVMGMAPETREGRGRGILAFAFYDRVQRYSALHRLNASQTLGHVIAHELGHLLLPHGSHSNTGIMRGPDWDGPQGDLATNDLLTFAPEEAALIRDRQSACVSRIGPE